MKRFAGIILILYILGPIGWVWNIVKIVQIVDLEITGMFIVRVIGVFVPPIGAIVGYL